MLKNFRNFINLHLDFKIYPITWFAIILLLIAYPCIKFLPQSYGYENGFFENVQMVVLFLGMFWAFKSKINKKFFNFVAMVIIILVLREINCGRTLFFPIPGTVNAYYGWKDIKYGYLAHPLYGLYMAFVGFYFLKNKLFINLWNLIKKIRFPFWNMLMLIVGMALGMYAEKALNNMVAEEVFELIFYVALVGIIYLYAYNKNFKIEES